LKRPLVAVTILIAVAFSVAVLFPASQTVQAETIKNIPSQVGADLAQGSLTQAKVVSAKDYCLKKGGEVDVRAPYFNTNADEQDWLRLAGERQFCKFTSKKDGSRIFVELSTLYSEQPTLAALAYYALVPVGTCNGNPASCYCSLLGGSDLFGGINAAGGGWVKKSDPVDTVLETCIFPDMSTIDSWGLAYHSFGITRGKDLSKVLRFKNPYGTN
jgi:hypothetical protein